MFTCIFDSSRKVEERGSVAFKIASTSFNFWSIVFKENTLQINFKELSLTLTLSKLKKTPLHVPILLISVTKQNGAPEQRFTFLDAPLILIVS